MLQTRKIASAFNDQKSSRRQVARNYFNQNETWNKKRAFLLIAFLWTVDIFGEIHRCVESHGTGYREGRGLGGQVVWGGPSTIPALGLMSPLPPPPTPGRPSPGAGGLS